MKQFSLFVAALFLAGACAAQRLPQTVVPDRYELKFAPDLTNNTFGGEETIQVRVLKPTKEIVLHAKDIDFQTLTVTSAGASQDAKVALEPDSQMARITTDREIKPGAAAIRIRYQGKLNDELRGFYIGKDDQGQKYAATQLEDTDARRAFPSFDEPALKATFDITVVADKDLTVISNGKIVSDSPGPG